LKGNIIMKKLLVLLVAITLVGGAFADGVEYNADSLSQGYSYNSGRVVAKYFTFTVAVASSNDTYSVTTIPANCRVIGGTIGWTALGAGRTIDVGLAGADNSGYISVDGSTTADDPDLFADGIDGSSAGVDTFASQENGDANANYILNDKETYLTVMAPASATAWDIGEIFTGVVYYMEN
jgi:hypothetical protein